MSGEDGDTRVRLETVNDVTAASGTPVPRTSRTSWSYGRLWRGVPRELGFLLPGLVVAVVAFTVMNSLVWTGIGTLVVLVGVFPILGALHVAWGLGALERTRLRWAGVRPIPRPRWRSGPGRPSVAEAVFRPFVSAHHWVALVHAFFVQPILGSATWALAFVWTTGALGGVTFWAWGWALPDFGYGFLVPDVVRDTLTPNAVWNAGGLAGWIAIRFVSGLLFLATLPYVTHALTLAHGFLARLLLGPWRSEPLEAEIADLSASRAAAVAAEDRSLRRLERDLHDGPQQRLLRLQLDLAGAERALAGDPETAARLLAQAREQARETLEELRSLSQGLTPPLLQDRGLAAALAALAARAAFPVEWENALPADSPLPPEVERAAYFAASELVANATKHSGASRAVLRAELSADPRALVVALVDDGRGGALAVPGHGLEGLAERLGGLRGELTVSSPPGGPTRVEAVIPVP